MEKDDKTARPLGSSPTEASGDSNAAGLANSRLPLGSNGDGPKEEDQTMAGANQEAGRKELDQNRIVRHIMVIGFHHKHGYQVDYCYPPLESDGPTTQPISLPACWKTLPLLCLPDGSHNYDSDTIYFTMPDTNQADRVQEPGEQQTSANTPKPDGIRTIFGTACYRQIQADKLLNRTDDMTRFAVQKSVCVLSTKPVFGLIRSKLEMITHAYFEELDFSKVKILKLTYDNLNSLLTRDSVLDNGTFLGLSSRQLVGQFNNNMLVLFKAMLLEKRILFYKSPVRDLCSTIMSMCSLFAGLLESGGLDYSTCDLQLSPTLLEALKLTTTNSTNDCDSERVEFNNSVPLIRDDKVFFSPAKDEVVIIKDTTTTPVKSKVTNLNTSDINKTTDDLITQDSRGNTSCPLESQQIQQNQSINQLSSTGEFEVINYSTTEELRPKEHEGEDDDQVLADGSIVDDPAALKLCRLKLEDCGLPLQIFTRGSFCLPYLSITYLDLLSDTRVKSFVIGATNFLFKQRKEIYDVIVDMEENTIIINDLQLKKSLALTTEDLRFMDYLIKNVKIDQSTQHNRSARGNDDFNDLISNDVTKWVGGDEWIRYHFKMYTLYLLKASMSFELAESFNPLFVQQWTRKTNNYKIWESDKSFDRTKLFSDLKLKHPFSSSTSSNTSNKLATNLNDMKLKLSYAVNNSEKGRILNQTISGIGKWSIWNNIASAATSASTSISSAAASSISSLQQQSQQLATPTNANRPPSPPLPQQPSDE